MTGEQIYELAETYLNGNKSEVVAKLRKLKPLQAAFVAIQLDRQLNESGYSVLPLLASHMHKR